MKKLILGIFLTVGMFANAFGQDVTGYWQTSGVGMLQYQNQATGATKSNRGNLFSYKFLANGTYESIGYMESTVYSCTTTLFNQITGRYTVEGSTINLDPSKDFWKSTNTCAPNSKKQQTKTPTKRSLEFEFKKDDYGKLYICLNDGKGETCYRKEKE